MRHWILGLVGLSLLFFVAGPAIGTTIEFDTELVALSLSGGPFPMPLGSNPITDIQWPGLPSSVEGYGFVDSLVTISLSSERTSSPGPASTGKAYARSGGDGANLGEVPDGGELEPIDPNELDGQQFFVDSFFDVFFDITVTDVDDRPLRNYVGQAHGASFLLVDNGPAHMSTFYDVLFDKDAPNFGLIPPPEVSPYIGHFSIEIPLGIDINGNTKPDKIKFTLVEHQVNGENRSYIQLPDGTVIDTFDSEAFLQGAIVDVDTDPPFTIGGSGGFFGGPTTASSNLLNGVVPEPSTFVVWSVLGFIALSFGWWRRRKA